MKLNSMLLGAALPLAAAAATAQPVEALLDQALAGPQRSVANKARDAARHPKETLLFFGLHPDQTVIEIAPGGGWYTEILAPVLRDKGTLYAAHYPVEGPAEQRQARSSFEDKLQANPAVYNGVKLGTPRPMSSSTPRRRVSSWRGAPRPMPTPETTMTTRTACGRCHPRCAAARSTATASWPSVNQTA